MRTLCIVGIIQAVFLSVIIASTSKRIRLNQKLLIAWLLTISISLIFNWISLSSDKVLFDLLLLTGGLKSLHGPLIFLYALSVLNDQYKLSWIDLSHFILYLLITSTLFYYHYMGGRQISAINGYLVFEGGAPVIVDAYQWLIFISTLIYPILGLFLLYRKRKQREYFFSNHDRVQQVWLRNFLIGVVSGYIVIFIYSELISIYWLVTYSQVAVVSTLVSVVLAYFATYINFRHQSQLNKGVSELGVKSNMPASEVAKDNRYARTGLDREKSAELYSQLKDHMDLNKPYLSSDLTLIDLSVQLKTTTNHLSQVINEHSGSNFFGFVNKYRIEAFKEHVSRGEHHSLTIAGIALNCGFSSKSSFYSIFKKSTGLTPSAYIALVDKN